MIHSVRFTAVLDTNVIYPVIIRDLLFWFAQYDMYTPKWSSHIFDEWKSVWASLSYPYSLATGCAGLWRVSNEKIVHVKIMALTNTSIQKALEINKAVAIMKNINHEH